LASSQYPFNYNNTRLKEGMDLGAGDAHPPSLRLHAVFKYNWHSGKKEIKKKNHAVYGCYAIP